MEVTLTCEMITEIIYSAHTILKSELFFVAVINIPHKKLPLLAPSDMNAADLHWPNILI